MLFGERSQTGFVYSVRQRNIFLLWSIVGWFGQVSYVLSDTREASLLFSYAKEVSESGALDQDENSEDVTGGFQSFWHPDVFTIERLLATKTAYTVFNITFKMSV